LSAVCTAIRATVYSTVELAIIATVYRAINAPINAAVNSSFGMSHRPALRRTELSTLSPADETAFKTAI
jgi:hypothetical protein